ncbi:putative reverse transcriptase domain-containing protein [Tanacetum coccineum]
MPWEGSIRGHTRVTGLSSTMCHDTHDLYALLEDAQDREAMLTRQRLGLTHGLSQVTHQELQTHRDHVYAHETHLQAHQTQLQLQSTLIQTQHQVHETRFQMQQAELAALRETDRRRQDQMQWRRMCQTARTVTRIPDHQDASGDADNPFQAWIDQALLRKLTMEDGSLSLHGAKGSLMGDLCPNAPVPLSRDNDPPKGNGCFECGAQGHFKRDCPKLKNKDGGNGDAQMRVLAVGNAGKEGK